MSNINIDPSSPTYEENEFISAIAWAMDEIHDWAHRKGFWADQVWLAKLIKEGGGTIEDIDRLNLAFTAEKDMLVVTELAEAVEGYRCGNPPDDKVEEYTSEEAEMADTLIRLLDRAKARNLRLGEAVVAKMRYNETRTHKHGKAF